MFLFMTELVRDRYPEVIKDTSGAVVVTHIAEDGELSEALIAQLEKQTREFATAKSVEGAAEITDLVEACVDLNGMPVAKAVGIFDLLDKCCEEGGISLEEVRKLREQNASSYGTYSGRVILDGIEPPQPVGDVY